MTPSAIHVTTAFLTAMGSAAARSLALGIFAAAALTLFRTRSVRVKLFVWKGMLLAALAMPALLLVSPAIRVAVPMPNLPERHESAAAAAPKAMPVADAGVADFLPDVPQKKIFKGPRPVRRQIQAQPAPTVTQESLPAAMASLAAAQREIPLTLAIVAGYFAIALALLIRVAIGVYLSSRLSRSAIAVADPRALRLLSAAADAAGLRTVPHLAESEMLTVPVMIGVLRPTILLTPEWKTWDTDELAAVLAHEVSHVARRDALAQRLALIHRAVFWFSPLGWWLERHLAELSEQASDEAALAGGMDRTR